MTNAVKGLRGVVAGQTAISVHVYGSDVRNSSGGLGECYFADDMELSKPRFGS